MPTARAGWWRAETDTHLAGKCAPEPSRPPTAEHPTSLGDRTTRRSEVARREHATRSVSARRTYSHAADNARGCSRLVTLREPLAGPIAANQPLESSPHPPGNSSKTARRVVGYPWAPLVIDGHRWAPQPPTRDRPAPHLLHRSDHPTPDTDGQRWSSGGTTGHPWSGSGTIR
jgi:hypothetical protein